MLTHHKVKRNTVHTPACFVAPPYRLRFLFIFANEGQNYSLTVVNIIPRLVSFAKDMATLFFLIFWAFQQLYFVRRKLP